MKKCLECSTKDKTIEYMNQQISLHNQTIAELSYKLRQQENELYDKDRVLFDRNPVKYQLVRQIKELTNSLNMLGEWY